jgi:preprotein translocase subunit YajC
MNTIWLLAAADETATEGQTITSQDAQDQAETTTRTNAPNAEPTEKTQREKPGLLSYLPLVAIFIVMYLLLFRGPQKKQQKHRKMVQALQKNDRVQTIGGILGTIVDVRDDEVIVKIDESNNTKIKVTTGAISKVLSNESD